jgi:hypothetical protein
MLHTNTVRRREDFARERVPARPESRLREPLVHFSNGCPFAGKSIARAIRLASSANARDALLRGHRLFAFEPAS